MSRPTLAAVALALMLAGCGHQNTQRASVAAYLKQVNRIEHALAGPLSSVTSAGHQFAQEEASGGSLTGLLPAEHEHTLRHALAKIISLRDRLAALRAPAPAATLRKLILELVAGQAQLTRELAQLVVFLPRYGEALRPLAPATRRLTTALAQPEATASASAATKAGALRQFKAAVDRVLGQVSQDRPPAVQRPAYTSELTSLRGMSSSAGELASALEGGSQGNIQPLLLRFDRAADLNQTVAAQKAQIAAIRAYDAQISRLNQLSQAAEQERLRLADNLS